MGAEKIEGLGGLGHLERAGPVSKPANQSFSFQTSGILVHGDFGDAQAAAQFVQGRGVTMLLLEPAQVPQ